MDSDSEPDIPDIGDIEDEDNEESDEEEEDEGEGEGESIRAVDEGAALSGITKKAQQSGLYVPIGLSQPIIPVKIMPLTRVIPQPGIPRPAVSLPPQPSRAPVQQPSIRPIIRQSITIQSIPQVEPPRRLMEIPAPIKPEDAIFISLGLTVENRRIIVTPPIVKYESETKLNNQIRELASEELRDAGVTDPSQLMVESGKISNEILYGT
jgi:hypothetical protein